MKQGLKIVFFVLPQLFALCLKANPVFSNTSTTSKKAVFENYDKHHLAQAIVQDDYTEFEREFEDDDDDEFSIFHLSAKVDVPESSAGNRKIDERKCCQPIHFRLYILYNSLKLHC